MTFRSQKQGHEAAEGSTEKLGEAGCRVKSSVDRVASYIPVSPASGVPGMWYCTPVPGLILTA